MKLNMSKADILTFGVCAGLCCLISCASVGIGEVAQVRAELCAEMLSLAVQAKEQGVKLTEPELEAVRLCRDK